MADMLYLNTRLAPYERRVIELLRNSKDKRARKLAKKRVRTNCLRPPPSFDDLSRDVFKHYGFRC